MSAVPQNIFLVGLMGAGKTTIGRTLARKLGLEFIDTDHEIEARTGVSIPVIFEIEGEEGFRRREIQTIADLVTRPGLVLATGGGAVLKPENREALHANGWVVYLNVPPHLLFERTKHDRNRPLLQVEDPLARLRELHRLRDPLYREVAHFIVDGGRHSAQNAIHLLTNEYRKRCQATPTPPEANTPTPSAS